MNEDEYVQKQADERSAYFNGDEQRYCECCGNKLASDDAYLCVGCEAD